MKNNGILRLLLLTFLNSVAAMDEVIVKKNESDIIGLNSLLQGNLMIEDDQKEANFALPPELSKIIIEQTLKGVSLVSLKLGPNLGVNDGTLEKIVQYKLLPNLTELDLSYTGIKSPEYIKYLKNIRDLNLSNTDIIWLDYLEFLTELTNLNLSYSRSIIGDGLKNLGGLTKLNSLDLSHTGVTTDHLGFVVGLTNLTNLNLGFTLISCSGLKFLARFLPNLTSLDLSHIRGITEKDLVNLNGMHKLTTVLVDYSKITGAENISKLIYGNGSFYCNIQ